ncbi:hypothetical protein LCL96_15305 [Rossellomorea aquimaris]|uniref:hypothetical protein n=1 Tax=Rossellomorea aquimaris TaxID=189382 RepID=UPI001CD59908|nr:hypothetical protein [Rossellomorea aquimaris]MCA1060305.1 hypothetical protein [Rossellomorea aquimaris]
MKKCIVVLLSLVLFLSTLSPSVLASDTEETFVDEEVIESLYETTGVDVSNVDLNKYEEDFDFLVNDEVFLQFEEHMILTDQDTVLEESSVQGQWVPIAAAAIRLLTSKVGREGMKKGWAIARPYVEKAIKAPSTYILEGAGGGGRIIQVRLKKTGSVVFRLDYFPIKTGGSNVLHYHVPPNLKTHHKVF